MVIGKREIKAVGGKLYWFEVYIVDIGDEEVTQEEINKALVEYAKAQGDNEGVYQVYDHAKRGRDDFGVFYSHGNFGSLCRMVGDYTITSTQA